MNKLFVNRSKQINGSMSINRTKKEDAKGREYIVIEGILKTHKYIEEIYEIESERYKLTEVDVIQECFGTDDFYIVYKFLAKELKIKHGESPFTDEEIEQKEMSNKDD